MSISAFTIGEMPIAAAAATDTKGGKAPPKRTVLAKADETAVPEPR